MIRPITINAVLNGFVVTVGCQTLVFKSVEELTGALGLYLKHPEETERGYIESSINRHHTMGPQTQPATAQDLRAGRLEVTERALNYARELASPPDAPTQEPSPVTQGASRSSL